MSEKKMWMSTVPSACIQKKRTQSHTHTHSHTSETGSFIKIEKVFIRLGHTTHLMSAFRAVDLWGLIALLHNVRHTLRE